MMNHCRLTIKTIVLISILFACCTCWYAHANSSIDTDQTIQAIDRAVARLEPMRATIDRSQFEISEFARLKDEAGTPLDGEDLVEMIRDQIRFQPYQGSLKGARGTLLTRAGNALDQALLTGAVLESAGLEVQLVRSRLKTELADRLLRSADTRTPDFPASIDLSMAHVRLQAIIRSLQLSDDWAGSAVALIDRNPQETSFSAEQTDTTNAVNMLMSRLGSDRSPAAVHAQLLEQTRDYFWVRWRATPSDPWADAHVAFSLPDFSRHDTSPIEVEQTLPTRIDDALKHFVSIQIIAEVIENGKAVERSLNNPWRESTAALAGTPIAIALLPSNASDPGSLLSLDQDIETVEGFILTINGKPVKGAGSVDHSGNVPAQRRPDALSNLSSGLGSALSGGLEQAPDKQTTSLSAIFVDYMFSGPEGTKTIRRSILDRLGPGARAAGNHAALAEYSAGAITRAISSERVFMLDLGPMSPAYLTDQAINQVLDKASAMKTMLSISTAPDSESEWTQLELEKINAQGHLTLIGRFFDDPGRIRSRMDFRPEAGLIELAVYPFRRQQGSIHSYVDIVRNPRRVLELSEEAGWQTDFAATLRAGIWETRMERTLALANHGEVFDTFVAFDRADNTQVFRPGDNVSGQIVDANLRARIEAEQKAGQLIVLAETSGRHSGWWRIDPETGQTLGMTSQGRGQSMVEYVETTAQRAQSLYGHVETIMSMAQQLDACQEEHGGLEEFDELFCCMAAVYADTASGAASGQAKETGLTGSLFVTILGAAASANGGSEQICNDLIANL